MKGATMTVLAMVVAGCGGGVNPIEKFVGTWAANDGSTQTSICTGGTAQVSPVTANMVIAAGVTYDLLIPNGDDGTCEIGYDVNGDTAMVAPNQSCPFALTDGTPETLVFTKDTLTTSDGVSMTEDFLGTYSSGACTVTQTNTLTKIAK